MFFSSTTRSVVLWQGWTTATWTGLALAMTLGTLLSLGLECLKCYRETHNRTLGLLQSSLERLFTQKRLASTLMHVADVLVGYLLMLIVMTFNLYIFIAVIIGAGLGHFFFRPLFLHRINNRGNYRQPVINTTNVIEENIHRDCGGQSEDHHPARTSTDPQMHVTFDSAETRV